MPTALRPPRSSAAELDTSSTGSANPPPASPLPLGFDAQPPTYAAFSPTTSLTGTVGSHRRSTILLHQKSPLLLATPPQITRALAYSHPFLAPINTFLGLVSWSSGDPWESFLLVAAWWGVVLYGDVVIRIAGPLVVVAGLILGMYGRRFSLLSSSGWSEFTAGTTLNKASSNAGTANGVTITASVGKAGADGKTSTKGKEGKLHKRNASSISSGESTSTRHQKTLDEIVATLRELTTRCNILLEPLLEMTDFLSTQRSPTTASTRPALTTLFVRLLLCTPLWWTLTLPPLRIVTTRRVVLVFGTVVLTWHAKPMRVAREILWRSRTIRHIASLVTGLSFSELSPTNQQGGAALSANGGPDGQPVRRESELTKALRRQQLARGADRAGVRFTFILYENQRRWVGLGWTTSLFGYERGAWTDEHNNPVPSKDNFELPEVEEGARARWRWVAGSRWRVDGVKDDDGPVDYDGDAGKTGWVYYDNKWQNGRRGQDGWGRWTRRRKWYRDAELVELDEEELAALAKVAEAKASLENKTQSKPASAPLPSRSEVALPPQLSNVTATSEGSAATGSTLVELADTSAARNLPGSLASEAHSLRESDSASIMSSSSRSGRGHKGPAANSGTMRRRPAGGTRDRRASEVASEDAEAALGTTMGLKIHGAGKEGWGLGDEARMSLE